MKKLEIKYLEKENSNGKLYYYIIPIDLLEKMRLENFLTVPKIAKKIGISARSYFGYIKEPKTTHVKLAKKIENFLNKT